MFFAPKKVVGIDVGSRYIKVAELDVTRRGASLVSFGIRGVPAGAIEGGNFDTEAVAGVIRVILDEVKTRRKMAAAALFGGAVIVKRISIPKMDESLIAEQIRWEAEQYIPYDLNDVNLAFHVLKKSRTSQETTDILLIAAVRTHVQKCAETVSFSGLECSVLDVGGFALANCFLYGRKKDQDRTYLLLNVGAAVTNFVVVSRGEVVFCRDLALGGSTYTSELQKNMNLSWKEAEEIKLAVSAGQPAPDEAVAIVNSTHDLVSDEIASSIDFCTSTSDVGQIDKCYVTGGGSRVTGLLQHLNPLVPSDRMDPFARISYNTKIFSASYIDEIRDYAAVAMGLGLRQPGDS